MRFFDRISLQNKFLIIPIVGLLVLSFPLIGVWTSVREVEKEIAWVEQKDMEGIHRLVKLLGRLNAYQVRMEHSEQAARNKLHGKKVSYAFLVEELEKLATALRLELQAAGIWHDDALPQLLAAYRSETLWVISQLKENSLAAENHQRQAEAAYHQLVSQLVAILEGLQADSLLSLNRVLQTSARNRYRFTAAFSAAFLLMALLAFILSRILSRDIRCAAEAMQRLAKGKLATPLPRLASSPETRALTEGLAAFRAALEQLNSRALELRTLNRELKQEISDRRTLESELRLTSCVFEHSSEGIMITDADGYILRVNRAFNNITGWSQEEVIGKTPRMFRSGKHDEEFYRELWQSLVETGAWQGEIWNKRKNGEIYPEWRNISAVRDDKGRTTHYISVFADISDRKQSAEYIDRLVHYDALTGLPNRILLLKRLERIIGHAGTHGRQVALLFLDLDPSSLPTTPSAMILETVC